jgi:type VI secretion system protein ImpJ
MKNNARPPYWYQGLFLQPQHFQYQELFFDYQVDNLRRSISSYLWGVGAVRFRENALDEHIVEMLSGRLWFQDGAVVNIPDNGSVPARSFRDIAEKITPGSSLKVYLALHRFSTHDKNAETVAPETSLINIRTRFVASQNPETVPNLYEGGDEAEIVFMRYLVRILWEHELNDYGDYTCIPVAEIESVGESLQFSQTYIPPVPALWCSTILREMVSDIQDTLLSRTKLLELYKISRPFRVEDFEGNFLRYLNALSAINHFIPALQHFLETPTVHPWNVYGLLRQLVGSLSTFTERINALGKLANGNELLPSYDHENLYHCFNETKILIRELLNSIIIEEENILDLHRDGCRFIGEVSAEAFDKRNMVCLLVRGTGDHEKLLNSLEHHAKIGSREGMDILIKRALDGVPVEYRQNPPPGMPVHPDGFIFVLNRIGAAWEEIRQNQTICLYWDEAPEDALAELIISRR